MTITIKTDNAAFQDGNKDAEVARILRALADKIASGRIHLGELHDINGNKVGKVRGN
jgi:hypothetical protein